MFKKMFGDKKEKNKEEAKKEKEKEAKKKEKKSSEEKPKKKPEGQPKKAAAAKPKAAPKKSGKRKKQKLEVEVDLSKPLEWPIVPEVLLEYHRHKPLLKPNEEWLLVELAEFECLIDNLEILQIIAKHSKFFELDPPELVEEFFEFVEDVPSYDEVINYDVWQEFRDTKYPC